MPLQTAQPPHRARAAAWLLLALLLGALSACEHKAPPAAPAAAGGPVASFPELAQVAAVVAETRAILPRVPVDVAPPPLAPATAPAAPPPRRVLEGEARLLRPDAFPALPPRLHVALYLDARSPPGGYLHVTEPRGSTDWPILAAVQSGSRDGAFAYTFRLRDGAARLRYLALLGVPYQSAGQGYRAFEGYLLQPATDGTVSAQGAVYPVDFGYRQPEPPPPAAQTPAQGRRLAALRIQLTEHEALRTRLTDQQEAARQLAATPVPAGQAARQRGDLADYAKRSAALAAERDASALALRTALLALYRDRRALAEAWIAWSGDNGYRWRTPPERRAAYAPLLGLRADYPVLEQAYATLDGEADPALRTARAAMEQSLLREQAHAPPDEQ